jgi:predicted  nucleic acid-binding Zn-ribbon protein
VVAPARGVAAETTARGERDAMLNAAFTPAALRALDFRIDDLHAGSAQAEREVAERRAVVAKQSSAVAAAQAAIRRNEQRIQGFEDHVAMLLQEREAAIEEAAEEETEETSTARFVKRQRAAREASFHE